MKKHFFICLLGLIELIAVLCHAETGSISADSVLGTGASQEVTSIPMDNVLGVKKDPAATESDGYNEWTGAKSSSNGVLGEKKIITYTSEPCGIAGEEESVGETSVSKKNDSGQLKLYKCEVTASEGFTKLVQDAYRFVFFISLIIGVLYIVVMGIFMSMSGVFGDAEEKKGEIKKKIVQIITGLFAMALIPWILKTIAPFFFK